LFENFSLNLRLSEQSEGLFRILSSARHSERSEESIDVRQKTDPSLTPFAQDDDGE